MKPLVLIPARGGSKGIKNKNIKLLNGIPLIYYTIDAALKIVPPSNICLSTDSLDIARIARERGVEIPFLRPSELASDISSTEDVILHALNYYKNKNIYFDVVILLQPTSPLRTNIHIKEALSLYTDDIDMVVSTKLTKSNPYYVLMEEDTEGFLFKSKEGNFTRRQDCPNVYEINGAIYVINVRKFYQGGFNSLKRRKKYLMDEYASVDIDNELDWVIAENILKSHA